MPPTRTLIIGPRSSSWATGCKVRSTLTTGMIVGDILTRIKRAVLSGNYAFSLKARIELESDGLTELDVAESILNAVAIYKKLRSTSSFRAQTKEYLYVIQSTISMGSPSTPRANWSTSRAAKPTIFLCPRKDLPNQIC